MGEMVEVPASGQPLSAYVAPAGEGAGLGAIVVADLGRLQGHVRDVCDRLAAEGFTALAPELTHDPGEAEAAADEVERSVARLSSAVDHLQEHPAVRGKAVGVVGFGPGAGLALRLAVARPDRVAAAVPFCGVAAWPGAEAGYARLEAAVEGHFAEHDQSAGPRAAEGLEATLTALGKEVKTFVYPGTRHGFFDATRADEYDEDAARQAWVRTLEFLRAKLG